ncbi:endolytic transglycosylase MltG [Paenibacillus lactis]|uniref:Endolytic murein transglycosylase n=1 Tax=Paenibacillus lactis 154 TaxID=743719 RepID=G4HDM7_9BACL|nr:aminodeoxychorismate lyase [Paenibacillus lactis 154]HAF99696.1 endolytic transglycosylase MltG [Paenibacillus lactis]
MKKLAIAALALILIAGGAAFYVWNGLQPVQSSDAPVEFTVEPGMSTSSIADLLEDKGLIKNALLLKGYLKLTNEGSRLMAGTYEATPGTPFQELLTMMNNGEVKPEEMVRFTIPEGFTVAQMAEKISEESGIDEKEILDLADQSSGWDIPVAAEIPEDPELKHHLEGYLFPATYELPKKELSAKGIVETMLKETEKRLEEIPNWEEQLKARGVTFHELMTIASLVEREVVVDHERPLVAGVIYNRLEQDMKLEIDATVQYLLDKPKERLLYADLEVKSPYNTYRQKGLPPGPIASPSLESIKAALNPEKSDYLFYVTKKDGTQEHLFAKTYKEHLKNIETSKKMGQQE